MERVVVCPVYQRITFQGHRLPTLCDAVRRTPRHMQLRFPFGLESVPPAVCVFEQRGRHIRTTVFPPFFYPLIIFSNLIKRIYSLHQTPSLPDPTITMQFTAVIFAGLAAIAAANPIAGNEPQSYGVSGAGQSGAGQPSEGDAAGICTALYTPQCCQTSILGVADLACNPRKS